MVDSSIFEYVRGTVARMGGDRSKNLTPDCFSNGLLGGDLPGSMAGGTTFVGLGAWVGDGGV